MSRVRTILATEVLLVVGLLVFVGLAFAAERFLALPDPVRLGPVVALLLAGVPGLLWLGYFYLQDRHEPEPKHFVFGVYLAGAFVAAPVAHFLVDVLAPGGRSALGEIGWTADRLVHAVLIVGLAQELTKLAVVRYSIYLSSEFDEPMDGIVYMTAAGIGFATAENWRDLTALSGVHLSVAATNAVITTLAHACFAGVLGVALGQARFGAATAGKRAGVLLGGLGAAAVLSGIFLLLEQAITQRGLAASPWRGLMLAAAFAAVVFAGVSFLMKRQLALSPHARPSGGAA